MGKMTVYHSSYLPVKHPEIIKGRNTKDFGPGFYCTVIREQAERWARRYDTPVLSTYRVRMDTSLNILEFIYNFISDYMDGIITRDQFWAMAKFKYPTHQINFCSAAALKCLEYVSSEEVPKS